MPSPPPVLIAEANHHLAALGQRLHAHRKAMKISAQAIAQAANISRVTLLRIERGVPSVTMGAYMNALEALGLSIDLHTRALPPTSPPDPFPERIQTDEIANGPRLAQTMRRSTAGRAAQPITVR
ncbi:helix-turn-helix domain-containing protein [Variovorax sp. V15]|uniref:helix-turn-helix domain-containing protein n=1 Tax=unclassified Variovorax TaxID=663243 RepID=UPI0034E8892D